MADTKDPHAKILALDSQLCFALYSTMNAMSRAYAPLLAKLDLTYPQYLAMLVLWEEDNIPIKELGARLFLDTGTLTPLLKRLEAAGIVTRTRDAADERQVRITLTPQGKALKRKAGSVPEGIFCQLGMTMDDVVKLRKELVKLRASLRGQD